MSPPRDHRDISTEDLSFLSEKQGRKKPLCIFYRKSRRPGRFYKYAWLVSMILYNIDWRYPYRSGHCHLKSLWMTERAEDIVEMNQRIGYLNVQELPYRARVGREKEICTWEMIIWGVNPLFTDSYRRFILWLKDNLRVSGIDLKERCLLCRLLYSSGFYSVVGNETNTLNFSSGKMMSSKISPVAFTLYRIGCCWASSNREDKHKKARKWGSFYILVIQIWWFLITNNFIKMEKNYSMGFKFIKVFRYLSIM